MYNFGMYGSGSPKKPVLMQWFGQFLNAHEHEHEHEQYML